MRASWSRGLLPGGGSLRRGQDLAAFLLSKMCDAPSVPQTKITHRCTRVCCLMQNTSDELSLYDVRIASLCSLTERIIDFFNGAALVSAAETTAFMQSFEFVQVMAQTTSYTHIKSYPQYYRDLSKCLGWITA